LGNYFSGSIDESCEGCSVKKNCVFFKSDLYSTNFLVDSLISFHFKKGQAIFLEGDKQNGIYIIKTGKIKSVRLNHDGKEVIFGLATTNDVLGYSILYNGLEHFEYSSVCIEDSSVCYLPYLTAKIIINDNIDFLKCIGEMQYGETIFMRQTIINDATKNVRERIAYSILILKNKFGYDQNRFIDIVLTRKEMAALSATTTESAIRYISEFQKEGIIIIENGKIKILDELKFGKLTGFIPETRLI
jgi:CRP-like cAMP-binding protein